MYLVCEAKCICCGWEWIAVYENGVNFLECPKCNKMCGKEK